MTVNPIESVSQIEPVAAQIEPAVPAAKSNIAKTITNFKESATKGLQNLRQRAND